MTMFVSRWKMMLGVVGVSIGGLAAIAGQCQKSDGYKTQRADNTPMTAEDPRVPPGGSGPAAKPTPPPVEGPDALALPVIPLSAPAKPLDIPPPPKPVKIEALPALPDFKPADVKKPDMPKPAPLPTVIPASSTDLPALPSPGVIDTPKPAAVPPMVPSKPVPAAIASPPMPPEPVVDPAPMPPAAKPVFAPAVPIETKYRIVLRVGEGEPMFEVRQGDDLIMKVKCEKVDIKSPEKGQGLSAVTAAGKVRFVGFGAEGTCDSLSFLAGTGEVAMAGNVKVQVKDKIGRVESELTADKMQYKLDNATLPGLLKP
jgi:hypothetical protein